MTSIPCKECGPNTPAFLPVIPAGACLPKSGRSSAFIPSASPRRLRHTAAPRSLRPRMAAASDDALAPPQDSGEPAGDSAPSRTYSARLSARRAKVAALRARFKVQQRIAIGFIMGAVVIAFVFSGRWIFSAGMLILCLLGQNEYYRMVAAKGHLPAYKTGLIVTATTMTASAISPALADAAFPLGGTLICIYLLFRQRRIATIADISTTFMGLFYAGYLPSFWVRLHEYAGGSVPGAVTGCIQRFWPAFLPVQPLITTGTMLVFWTWLACASADIGAFFIGRAYGQTRFSSISPKKTVEGAIAGFCCSASVSMLGAFLLKWPLWWATGAVYGFMVGVVGLFGDLFESCLKRDVGWKDSGSLFPGHGGILDRADSYVLIAPLVYFFSTLVLPVIVAALS